MRLTYPYLFKYIFPVSFGSFIYASCRPSILLYERVLRLLFKGDWLTFKMSANNYCSSFLGENIVSYFIVYSLPNALWVLAFCFFLDEALGKPLQLSIPLRICIFLLVALAPDLLQLMKIMKGTYDSLDVFAALLSAGVVSWTAIKSPS